MKFASQLALLTPLMLRDSHWEVTAVDRTIKIIYVGKDL